MEMIVDDVLKTSYLKPLKRPVIALLLVPAYHNGPSTYCFVPIPIQNLLIKHDTLMTPLIRVSITHSLVNLLVHIRPPSRSSMPVA